MARGRASVVRRFPGPLVIGIAAEQVTTRPRWLLGYFGAGLVGEFVGYAWQPVGGGNSVALCGLASVVAVARVIALATYRRFPIESAAALTTPPSPRTTEETMLDR